MIGKILNMVNSIFLALFIIATLLLAVPRMLTFFHSKSRIFPIQDSPTSRVAIVFGAGLWRDGQPTPILRDRVSAAAELYFNKKVDKLLMSGDNQVIEYNEPAAMKDYALSLGVPELDIVLDFAGRRTYDTCYRAKHIFHIDDAILVTQSFHLPRALFICHRLGIHVTGVMSDLRKYRKSSLMYWNLREIFATSNALWEIYVAQPKPVMGKPEPIFPVEKP